MASITIRLQASRSLALYLHSFIPIFLRSVNTSSSHLVFGFLCVLLRTAFGITSFWGLLCPAFFLCDQAIVFVGF
jgi:hypothetical protein